MVHHIDFGDYSEEEYNNEALSSGRLETLGSYSTVGQAEKNAKYVARKWCRHSCINDAYPEK